ncbi:hypothetical protein [Streptomyces triticagri]|uniref:hypothetical protein n=1 Tax=Streptomyces triticagri TaxID=2293568 RepID=UPI001F20B6B9|nr:hypothetical protein [Streptomyces triticagri]
MDTASAAAQARSNSLIDGAVGAAGADGWGLADGSRAGMVPPEAPTGVVVR